MNDTQVPQFVPSEDGTVTVAGNIHNRPSLVQLGTAGNWVRSVDLPLS